MSKDRTEYELKKWQWAVGHMERLIGLNAPGCIKAHALIGIILPRLIRQMNIVEEASQEIAGLVASGLAFKSCMCSCCKKVKLTLDDRLDTCPKCTSEIDQYGVELELSPEEKLMDAIFNCDPSQDDEDEESDDEPNTL